MRRFAVMLGIVGVWCGPLGSSGAEASEPSGPAESGEIQVMVRVDVATLLDDLLVRAGELSVRAPETGVVRVHSPGRSQHPSALRPAAGSGGAPVRPRSRPSPEPGGASNRSRDGLAATTSSPTLEPPPLVAPAVSPPDVPVSRVEEAAAGPRDRSRSGLTYVMAALGALMIPLGVVLSRGANREASRSA